MPYYTIRPEAILATDELLGSAENFAKSHATADQPLLIVEGVSLVKVAAVVMPIDPEHHEPSRPDEWCYVPVDDVPVDEERDFTLITHEGSYITMRLRDIADAYPTPELLRQFKSTNLRGLLAVATEKGMVELRDMVASAMKAQFSGTPF